jgi:hypothetical protein
VTILYRILVAIAVSLNVLQLGLVFYGIWDDAIHRYDVRPDYALMSLLSASPSLSIIALLWGRNIVRRP